MKKCATCDFEYDQAYDGCPVCARAAALAPLVGYGSGNILAALGALMGYVVAVGVILSLTGSQAIAVWGTLLAFAVLVVADASTLHKNAPAGFKAEGMPGTAPVVWGMAVFVIAIIGIPLYFYQRPRIARAYAAAR